MKVLYITNGISGSGGLERVLSIKTNWLIGQRNYEVHIITINDSFKQPFYDFNSKIIFHNLKLNSSPIRFYKEYLKSLKKTVAQIQPDIISVCDDGFKGVYIPKILDTSIPLVYERHASIQISDIGGLSSKILKGKHYLMKKGASDYDKVVLLTEGNKKEWEDGNIEVIPNPISFSTNKPSTLENKKVILVGTLGYNKGTDLMIEIWNRLYANFPKWELHIYGKLVNIESYQKQVKGLGIQGLFFHQPVRNIQEKFIESSIAVVPSRSEGFGMVIIEAMECGLPVVSFDCPQGPGDIITHEKDGFLIEPLNIESFKEKLKQLMKNKVLREKMAKNARQKAKDYDVEHIMVKWDNLFNSLVH